MTIAVDFDGTIVEQDVYKRQVGDPAKRQAITNPQRTIFSIKRFMGETWDQVQKEIAHT